MTAFEFKILLLAILLGITLGGLISCAQICRRAGVAPHLSALILIPIVNVVAVYWFSIKKLNAVVQR